jgi:amino acid permease
MVDLNGDESEQLLDKHDDFDSSEERKSGASLASGVLNLTNTLLGGGIAFIALPLAAKQLGVPLLVALVLLSMVANTFTCILLVKSAEISSKRTYFDLAATALGAWKHAVTLFIFLNNFGVCVAFIATFGDVFPEIMSKWHAGGFLIRRFNCVVVVTLALLLPMLTLTNLDALRFFSACSIVLCTFFVAIVIASSSEVHGPPAAPDPLTFVSFLQALSLITLSYTCHYNILPVQNELRSPAGIRPIIYISMGTAAALFCVVGVSELQVQQLTQIYTTTTDCCLTLSCTWNPTARSLLFIVTHIPRATF